MIQGDGVVSGRADSSRWSSSASTTSMESQVEVCSNVTDTQTYEFEPKTQNEMFLWKTWKQAEDKIRQLETTIKTLQHKTSTRITMRGTDKEELERETGWSE